MDIVVKGRHTDVADRFRQHAVAKLAKVERLDAKVIRVDVEVSREHNPRQSEQCERVELTCRSRGPVIRAEAAAADPYAALDLAYSRLEGRLRKAADRRRVHHGNRTPVSVGDALGSAATGAPGALGATGGTAAPEPDGPGVPAAAPPAELTDTVQVDGDGPLVVREKVHAAEPMSLDQALFAMELVGHDFFLFADRDTGRPSVVYRRHGYAYGVIRLDR